MNAIRLCLLQLWVVGVCSEFSILFLLYSYVNCYESLSNLDVVMFMITLKSNENDTQKINQQKEGSNRVYLEFQTTQFLRIWNKINIRIIIIPTLSLSACLEHRNIVGIGFACLCYNGMEVHGVQEPSIYAFLGIKVAVNNICLDVT